MRRIAGSTVLSPKPVRDDKPLVGVIANPVSARDIRRVIANATSLQVADRANILLRVMAALGSCSVERVLMMPENGGIGGLLQRGLTRERNLGERTFPELERVETRVSGTVEDTLEATAAMRDAGVDAIVVLGGDGTHRAVATECGPVPIAGVSTGTNNAFPEQREPTITGLAVGLAVTRRVPEQVAYIPNKRLRVDINGGDRSDIALVDIAICAERYIGARALWHTENFRELFVTFANPEAIGMSAIAALVQPLSRSEPRGLHVRMGALAEANERLSVPIAPGLIREIGIVESNAIGPDVPVRVRQSGGVVALDGERELEFGDRDEVTVTLEKDAFRTVDVAACMHYAATHRLMVGTATGLPV